MFGPEFENIKEYKPYINKLEISEDIIDNEVDKLENKQLKPEITEIKKDEKLLVEEKEESTKEIKEKIIQTELTKQEIEDIKKPISIKMFGPEFENIKEYKPYISKLEISEDIIDNEVDKLFKNKQNKPEIKDKVIEKEKEPIKEIKESLIKEIKEEPIKEIKEKPIKEIKEQSIKEIAKPEIIKSEIEDIKKPISIKMFGPEFENIKEYKPYVSKLEISEDIIDNEVDKLENKQNKPEIKLSDKVIEKEEEKPEDTKIFKDKKEEIIQTVIEDIKKPIITNKMFGPEFENIKEYKPYINKLEISEDIIDNEVDKLFENKQNKPEITEIKKDEKLLIKEKDESTKEIKEKIIQTELTKQEIEDIKKPIIINKMFGPEFEINKEYKPYVSKLEISEDIIDNEVDKLFENKQNKPEIKDKVIEIKEEIIEPIKEIKEEITKPEIIQTVIEDIKKPIIVKIMFGSEFENIKEYKPYDIIKPESEISEDIIDNEVDKLFENKQFKPEIN